MAKYTTAFCKAEIRALSLKLNEMQRRRVTISTKVADLEAKLCELRRDDYYIANNIISTRTVKVFFEEKLRGTES